MLDYVVAHEVAHLVELNHSPRFWAVVRRLCPDYEAPRDWLRRNGAGLHGYDFGLDAGLTPALVRPDDSARQPS